MLFKVMLVLVAYYVGKSDLTLEEFLVIIGTLLKIGEHE